MRRSPPAVRGIVYCTTDEGLRDADSVSELSTMEAPMLLGRWGQAVGAGQLELGRCLQLPLFVYASRG